MRMNLKHLKITREEYINILKNGSTTVLSDISTDRFLRRLNYLRKEDFRYIANKRGIPTNDDMSSD